MLGHAEVLKGKMLSAVHFSCVLVCVRLEKTKDTKETWKLNSVWNSGLDPETDQGH